MSDLTLEQALILLDESRQQNIAMLDRLYESLDIDDSDGEIRFKWVMIEIEELKQERNALVATVEVLRSAYEDFCERNGHANSLHEAFNATPQQRLRNIRTETIKQASNHLLFALGEPTDAVIALDKYAERVEDGEK